MYDRFVCFLFPNIDWNQDKKGRPCSSVMSPDIPAIIYVHVENYRQLGS